jgi:hypothetical protein
MKHFISFLIIFFIQLPLLLAQDLKENIYIVNLALCEFKNASNLKELDFLKDKIYLSLAKSLDSLNYVRLTPRSRIEDVLLKLKKKSIVFEDKYSAVTLGALLNVEGVIIGEFTCTKKKIFITGWAIDVVSGKIIASEILSGGFYQIDDLLKTLAGSLSLPFRRGSLKVNSHPSYAFVFLNGKLQGRTPFFSSNLRIGTYIITLKKRGYREFKKKIKVSPDETLCINAILTCRNLPFTVYSVPLNAEVYLKNAKTQREIFLGRTPLKKKIHPSSNAWEYLLVVRKLGYFDRTEKINLVPEVTHKYRFVLFPKDSYGKLIIDSVPANCKVFLEGKFIGLTPIEIYKTEGTYQIRIEHPSYRSYSGRIHVEKGRVNKVMAFLKIDRTKIKEF